MINLCLMLSTRTVGAQFPGSYYHQALCYLSAIAIQVHVLTRHVYIRHHASSAASHPLIHLCTLHARRIETSHIDLSPIRAICRTS